MKKIYFYEIARALVYLAAYNYIYVISQPPYTVTWLAYMSCFLPVSIFSGTNYYLYFHARNLLRYRISNKYIAALAVLLAYALVTFTAFLFVSQVLANPEVVTVSLSRASIYSPLILLPFLVMECIFEKLGDPRLL